MQFAEVFVNIPVKSIARSYTYRIPPSLAEVDVGWRVLVPFGGRKVEGFVVALTQATTVDEARLKDIAATVDEEAWFTPAMIETARWLSDFYLCSLAEMMRLFMPGKSGVRIEARYQALPLPAGDTPEELPAALHRYLSEHGPQKHFALRQAFPGMELAAALEKMQRRHWLEKVYQAQKKSADRYEEWLCRPEDITPEQLAGYARKPAQLRLLSRLRETAEIPLATLRKEGFSRPIIQAVVATDLARVEKRRCLRDSYREAGPPPTAALPPLTDEQQAALDSLLPSLRPDKARGFLLYGVTGSGKTRLYMEATAAVRRQGRQVIVLVPEIALTGQLVRVFRECFAGDIVVIHSGLSVAERNDAYFRIRREEAGIIIGARSALFTPAARLGLIIMDEEQDMSYKQDEPPRYQARTVAAALARIHRAVLLLGSATPSLETFHFAREGRLSLLTLPHRVENRPLPTVECVDMRQELRQGNRQILSRPLQAAIHETVAARRQVVLMLNRRGYSTFIMCRSCGHVIVCRFCGLPLVYHQDGRLACHHCDAHETPPDICPSCGSTYIRYFGSGTEKLEQELARLVPEARVIRLDRDTARRKFAHTGILDAFRRGEYDILLGTQMVAKGHDIPNVTTVGIISADASLNLPDFRAAERCFALITQTAGRAGRGDVPGRVLVQCYNPEHYAVQCAIHQDYEGFYRQEAVLRQELFFPPFCRLVKLTFLHEDEARAQENAARLRDAFLRAFPKSRRQQILGPAPAIVSKYRGVYRFCLLIKTDHLPPVQDFLRTQGLHRRTDVWIDIDPAGM